MTIAPPVSEQELEQRASKLAGLTLGALAQRLGRDVPSDLRRAKGFVGGLLEEALGATAKSRAVPDFEALGVELKSIPVNRKGVPVETTFVCTIPLLEVGDLEWEHSRVRSKLARVLWIPVLGEREIAPADRVIGSPLLWSPTPAQEQALRWDWEELAGIIGRGDTDSITGHLGKVMQVRPKAADRHARRRGIDAAGRSVQVMPRGFYLRTQFTAAVLSEAFVLPH